ncbi:prefoldin 6 [Lycorma delicatula]|uniref:prefoldin 6 n=1 Tax=Lycorma delicatula TaxID=130591 RepID=UPI003F518B7C
MSEELQKKLQTELENFKSVQKEYHKAISQRQQLDGQLNENIAVKEELDLMKADAEVFKLIGPVLIKQELEEAKQNVAKRIDYINGELKRVEDLISSLDSKQDTHREKLAKLQQQFQQQAKVAMKA